MNHHLRFLRQSALAPSIAALALSSCSSRSSNKIASLTALPDKEITYEIQLFDVPADHPFGKQKTEILSAEEGEKLIKSLAKHPSFFATIGADSGEKKTLSTKRKFVYVTEYTPAKFTKAASGTFPATPATPISFDSTRTGTTISVKAQPSATGEQQLDVAIDRNAFLGFTNYGKPITADATDFFGRKVSIIITENRIEKPSFRRDRSETAAKLPEGSYLALRNIGANPVIPGKFPFTSYCPAGYLALVRVATP